MRKWIKRIVLSALALVVLVLVAGLVYEQWSRWIAARRFPPPGQLVEVEGRNSHLYCTGEGTPTVVLESGLDTFGAMTWATVQPAIARTARVCSYDRAGIGWSEPRAGSRDAVRIVEELHDLLAAASESPPYVMVGHSLGGPLAMVFADRFEGEVVGLVFVDSSHPEQFERFPPETSDDRALPPTLLLKAIVATGVIRLTSPGAPEFMPEEIRSAVQGLQPRSLAGALDELDAMEVTFAQAAETGPFSDLPLVVLTAGRAFEPSPSNWSPETVRKVRDTWLVLQAELAALSTNADQRIVEDSGHYIQFESPGAVITAIRDVVTAVREDAPVPN
jgi:pimeloyl-ACP methyl ester carboxylesterase